MPSKPPSSASRSPSAGSAATAPLRLDGQPWLDDPALRAVIAALADGGYEARIVGGAVRNALMGRPVIDVDLATPARPEEVMRLALAARLGAIPTGIEHGTITVISGHTPFEVTTLRRDIETFGRHARVTFTTDWSEDARRRDFTINALYCAPDGHVHDPLGGWPDLAARRVRFIGDAGDRIREDYLRILRFFRFTAQYAEDDPDPPGLAAAVASVDGLDGLSGERLRAEMLKLVVAPRAAAVLEVMDRATILGRVVGPDADLASFARLVAIDRELGRAPDPALRLACLAASTSEAAARLRDRLRLSNAEAATLDLAAQPPPTIGPDAPETGARVFIYRRGPAAFEAALLIAWARSGASALDGGWRRRLELARRFPQPVLPVRGSDVLALGIGPGPEVGRILGDFEDWWIAAGFPADRPQHLRKLNELAAHRPPPRS